MLCFRKILVANFLWIRGGGGYQDLPAIFFVSETREKHREPFCAVFQEIAGSEKVYA